MSVTIYFNPRCSKCREVRKLVEARGIEPEIVEYLDNPPDAETIERLAGLADVEPRELLRTGDPDYRENKAAVDALEPDALCRWLARHPAALQRPIVVRDGEKAIVARPPERVESLFEE